jgi:exosortase
MPSECRSQQPPFKVTALIVVSWRLLLLVLVLTPLYGPTIVRLALQWYHDPEYSHGFFVVLLAGHLVWRKRQAWVGEPRKPSWLGLPIIVGSLGLLYLGTLGAELFLTRISLWLVVVGLILYFEGSHRLRTIAFPMAFLLFMIPLPAIIYTQIVFPLQLLASRCASRSLEAIDLFPVMREGNLLILPNSTLEVVEACSGIRSLMALLALASLYGYLRERSLLFRIVLIAAMVPLAVAANAVRVMVMAFCTQIWGTNAAESVLHPLLGILVFFVATGLLLALHCAIVLLRGRSGPVVS